MSKEITDGEEGAPESRRDSDDDEGEPGAGETDSASESPVSKQSKSKMLLGVVTCQSLIVIS